MHWSPAREAHITTHAEGAWPDWHGWYVFMLHWGHSKRSHSQRLWAVMLLVVLLTFLNPKYFSNCTHLITCSKASCESMNDNHPHWADYWTERLHVFLLPSQLPASSPPAGAPDGRSTCQKHHLYHSFCSAALSAPKFLCVPCNGLSCFQWLKASCRLSLPKSGNNDDRSSHMHLQTYMCSSCH